MHHSGSQFRWITRILLILFVVFLTSFSLDVFEMQANIWVKLGAFVVHSIPSLVLTVITFIAWNHPVVGGILLLGGVAAFTVFSRVQSGEAFSWWRLANPVFIIPVVLGILLVLTPVVARAGRSPATPAG